MNCPICGAQLPEGSAVCGYCGNPISAQPQSGQKSSNSGLDKNAKKLLPITFLLTLALLVASIFVPLSGSLFKIPLIDTALNIAGVSGELDAEMDNLDDMYDQLEDEYEVYEDELSRDAQKAVKKIMKATKSLVKTPSLLNFKSFFSTAEKVADDLDDEEDIFGVSDITDGLEEAKQVLGIMIGVAVAMFALPALFTLLAGFKKSMGLTITALVFMVLTQLMLCGILWVLMSLVVYIFQAVLCKKAKNA